MTRRVPQESEVRRAKQTVSLARKAREGEADTTQHNTPTAKCWQSRRTFLAGRFSNTPKRLFFCVSLRPELPCNLFFGARAGLLLLPRESRPFRSFVSSVGSVCSCVCSCVLVCVLLLLFWPFVLLRFGGYCWLRLVQVILTIS